MNLIHVVLETVQIREFRLGLYIKRFKIVLIFIKSTLFIEYRYILKKIFARLI